MIIIPAMKITVSIFNVCWTMCVHLPLFPPFNRTLGHSFISSCRHAASQIQFHPLWCPPHTSTMILSVEVLSKSSREHPRFSGFNMKSLECPFSWSGGKPYNNPLHVLLLAGFYFLKLMVRIMGNTYVGWKLVKVPTPNYRLS